MAKYDRYKESVRETTLKLVEKGYMQGLGGNVSMLVPGEKAIVIIPSQKEYLTMTVDDVCVVDFNQNPIEDNGLMPSMETGLHIAVYKGRADASAVIHTHQVYASIFALINLPIPALFDEIAISIGSTVEVVPYGFTGSEQLLSNVAARLENRAQCYILQNHGALAIGSDLSKALRNAELLEKCAQIYYHALSTGRPISQLPAESQQMLQSLLQAKQDMEIAKKGM